MIGEVCRVKVTEAGVNESKGKLVRVIESKRSELVSYYHGDSISTSIRGYLFFEMASLEVLSIRGMRLSQSDVTN